VVFAARRVVFVAPDFRVDVSVFHALVIRRQIPEQRLVVVVAVPPVGVGALEDLADLRLGARSVDRHSVHLLGRDVLCVFGDEHAVDKALFGLFQHDRTLDQLVAVEGDHAPFDRSAEAVAGASDAL